MRMVLFKNQPGFQSDEREEMKRFFEGKNDLGKDMADANFKAALKERARELYQRLPR